MPKVSDYIKENIYRAVKKDVDPSRLVVHSKVGASVAAGGALSLFLCGQMGLGLSPFAEKVHGLLMHYGGFLGCTVLCGFLFAIVPVLLLKLLTSSVQYLVILRQERPAIAAWVLAFGLYLVIRNQQSDFLLTIVLWGIPAIFSFYALGWLAHRFSSVIPWQQSQGFF